MHALAIILGLLGTGTMQPDARCTVARLSDHYVREPTETWIVGTVLPGAVETDSVLMRNGSRRVNRGHIVRIESVTATPLVQNSGPHPRSQSFCGYSGAIAQDMPCTSSRREAGTISR